MSFRDPRDVLKAHGSDRCFGQTLILPQVPERIAMVGGARSDDVIFEITGCGTLTRALAPRCERLIALEYDRDLVGVARSERPGLNTGVSLESMPIGTKLPASRQPIVITELPVH